MMDSTSVAAALFVASLSLVIPPINGQIGLHFQSGQSTHWLELLCDVIDIKQTNFSHLDSLVISKVSSSGSQVLASVSAHYDQNGGPVSHVPDAVVKGEITGTTNHPLKQFLKMTWNDPQPSLTGFYKCEGFGVDANYVPVQDSVALRVEVKSSGIFLTAEPEIVREGLTQTLDINCTVKNVTDLGMTKLSFLQLFRIHNGVRELITEVKSISDQAMVYGSPDFTAHGSIDQNGTFLGATWKRPGIDATGEYLCQGCGISTSGDPVFFSRSVSVAWDQPDRQELVNQLQQLYKEQSDSARQLKEDEQLIMEANETIHRLRKSSCPKSCNDISHLDPGLHQLLVAPEDGMESFLVLCEVVSHNESWTVFQKRFDGSVDFYRNFSDYEDGFGDLDGEFWLGLRNLRRLILEAGNSNQLEVDMMEAETNVTYIRTYPIFSVGPAPSYRLNVSGFNDRGYGMSINSGNAFSTYDHGLTSVATAKARSAGWWFGSSNYVNLNGLWGVKGSASSIYWYEFRRNIQFPMEKTMMKFRPRD